MPCLFLGEIFEADTACGSMCSPFSFLVDPLFFFSLGSWPPWEAHLQEERNWPLLNEDNPGDPVHLLSSGCHGPEPHGSLGPRGSQGKTRGGLAAAGLCADTRGGSNKHLRSASGWGPLL